MSNNYNETEVAGTSYTRCKVLSIINTLEQEAPPTIIFHEEKIVNLGDEPIKLPLTNCSRIFSPTRSITVINPETGVATGQSITEGELYTYLYSAYIQTATDRDAMEAAQAT